MEQDTRPEGFLGRHEGLARRTRGGLATLRVSIPLACYEEDVAGYASTCRRELEQTFKGQDAFLVATASGHRLRARSASSAR